MFAPALGVAEDPATGSACVALVGALAEGHPTPGNRFDLKVLQGVAMGRRSEIMASAYLDGSRVTSVTVGGHTAFVAEGEIEVPESYLAA